jgi:hypothetical protein
MKPIKTTNFNDQPVFAYAIKGMNIYDPTVSECARFSVDPVEYYGLTREQVQRLIDLNNSHGYEWET